MSSKTPRIDKLEKNLIINGNFDYWQRGTSFPYINGGYGTDRWKCSNSIDTNIQIVRSTVVPNNLSEYSMRVEVYGSVGSPLAFSHIRQPIEDKVYRSLLGKEVTLGFWAKLDAGLIGTGKQNVVILESSDVNVSYKELANTTEWQYVVLRKVFPTSLTYLNILFQMSRDGVAVGQGVNFSQVQLLEGNIGLDGSTYVYAGRDIIEELQLCQRYYEKSYDVETPPTTNTAYGICQAQSIDNNRQTFDIPFKVTKRARPTPTLYSYNGVADRVTQYDSLATDLTYTVGAVLTSKNNIHSWAYLDVGVSSLSGVLFHWSVDAEL